MKGPPFLLLAPDAKAGTRPNRLRIAAIAFGVMLAATRGSADADNGPVFRRWAVAATAEVQATGVSDLLAARLSAVPGMELVEREQLAAALREQKLSACFGSSAVPLRLKLGQLLQADILVLLSLASPARAVDSPADSAVADHAGSAGVPPAQGSGRDGRTATVQPRSTIVQPGAIGGAQMPENRFLRLVISDCVYGARLHVDYLPFDANAADALAARCATAVLRTRRKFAGGIQRVIGVTHFLSQNLTHDYDHLQAGFAALLENSLRAFPGVAAIEIEEAQAIGRELSVGAGGLKRPAVPLFVQGEFKMAAAESRAPLVWLSLRLAEAGSADTQIEREGLTLPQAVELLTGELPRQILRLSSGETAAAIGRPELERLLNARADAFSLLGAYESATGLREAALLLDADDLAQRIRLICDYDRWQLACNQENTAKVLAISQERRARGKVHEDPRMWAKTHAQRMARFRMTTPHIEYLIDRRLVNPMEATHLASGTVHSMRLAALPQEREYAQEDKQALEEFFWRVVPLFPKLDCGLRDGTLTHLGDLYNLTDLYLVEAPVSDEGLRHIGQLKNLESLCLVATQVTDGGIADLGSLPHLSYCRLQASRDQGNLTDAALESLAGLPRLVAITLVGPGFTDAALTHLQSARRLRELHLWGTGITPAAIAGLRKSKPWLIVSETTPD